MAVTHYTQWKSRVRGTLNGEGALFEIRINVGTNDYDWDVSNPTDSILLKDLIVSDFGRTRWQRFDENADMVAAQRIIEIIDSFSFNGMVDGSEIGVQDLIPEKTSLIPFIFNDPAKTYHVWLSHLDPNDFSLIEIYFYGQVVIPFFEGQFNLVFQPMGNAEMKRQTKKILITSVSELLKNRSIEEIVSGSMTDGVHDGIVAGLGAADVFTIGGFDTKYKPWFYGMIQNPDYGGLGPEPIDGFYNKIAQFQAAGTLITNTFNPCYYVGGSKSVNPLFPFGWSNNMYGMPDGFQAVSYATVLGKMAEIAGFTFSSADSDNVFAQYIPSFTTFTVDGVNADRYNLQGLIDTHILDVVAINYNVRFGVKPVIPNQLHFSQNDDDGSFQTVAIDSVAGTSPTILTLHDEINMIVGISGQRIGINDGAGKHVYYMTVIDQTHVSLQNAAGSPASYSMTGTAALYYANSAYWDWNTPVTFDRTKSFSEMLKIICFRFGYLIDWDIHQSGPNKGLPKLILRDMLKSAGSIPSAWQSQTRSAMVLGGDTGAKQLPKQNVALHYAGDDAKIYCPVATGESISIEINGRSKQWGRKFGYILSDIINNANEATGQQQDTCFGVITITDKAPTPNVFFTIDLTSPSGWVPGAADYYYLDNPSSMYNSTLLVSAILTDTGDWSGFYPISYEDYGAAQSLDWDARLPDATTIHDGRNTPLWDNRFNTLNAKAIYYANVFLNSSTVENRSFNTATDDDGMIRTLRPCLTGDWQDEDGIVRTHLIHSIEVDESHSLCICQIVPAPPSPGSMVQYEVVVKNGSGGGGSTGGAGVNTGGGGGTNPSNTGGFVKTLPKSPSDNIVQGDTDTQKELILRDKSDTHSADKLIIDNKDGTIIYGGLHGYGSTLALGKMFFTNTKNAFEIKSDGANTGEFRFYNTGGTHYTAIKANGTIASDVTFTLPNADGSNTFVIQTNGIGVLSFVDPTSFIPTAAVILAPSTPNRNRIQSTANNTSALEIKGRTSESVPHFVVTDSTGTNQFTIDNTSANFFDQNLWIIQVAGRSGIGLVSAGPSLSFGNSGDVLTSGGPSGPLSWTPPSTGGVTSITGTVHQIIASASTGAVTLSTPQDIDTTSAVRFARLGLGVNPDASIPLLVDRSAVGASHVDGIVSQNVTAATSGVQAQFAPRIRQHASLWNTGSGGSSKTVDAVLRLSTTGGLSVNPFSWNLSVDNSDGSGYVDYIILGYTASSTRFVQFPTYASTDGVVTLNGGTLTMNTLAANSILFAGSTTAVNGSSANFKFAPSTGLLIKQPTSGNLIETLQSNGSSSKTQANEATVAGGATTLIDTFATASDTVITCRYVVTWRQTNGANLGKGGFDIIQSAYHNISGVLVQIGGDAHGGVDDSNVPTPTAATNVNGTSIEIKLTAPATHNYNVSVFSTYYERA
jgi:hypothetical protein